MITIAYTDDDGKNDSKEFGRSKIAAKYVEKICPKEVVNNITQGFCTGLTWGKGTIECDVPFSSFIKKVVYFADEPDRSCKKIKRKTKK